MTKRKPTTAVPLPIMATELALSSWEAIVHRTWMMSLGYCSPAEYQRMVMEKVQAVQETGLALTLPWTVGTAAGLIAPWHSRATANARRLRKR